MPFYHQQIGTLCRDQVVASLNQPKVFCFSLNSATQPPGGFCTLVLSTVIYKSNKISLRDAFQPAIGCPNYNNTYIVNIAQPDCVVILKCGHKIYPLAPGLVSVLLAQELRSTGNYSNVPFVFVTTGYVNCKLFNLVSSVFSCVPCNVSISCKLS